MLLFPFVCRSYWRTTSLGRTDYFTVIAGWLQGEPVIGECFIDEARGTEVISFEYDRNWVASHPNLLLDPDLLPMPGRQYVPRGKFSFGFLSDAAPDRWGRKLQDRRELLDARAEHRTARKLMESDYLLGVHDGGRMGGLRFRDKAGNYLSDRENLAAPPITELRKLQDAVYFYENNTEKDEEKWFRSLLEPGSSLGGARPKANVLEPGGSMWIAKFPSRNDVFDVGAWEMVAHDLSALCGVKVPPARLERFSEGGSTYLVRRFDRVQGAESSASDPDGVSTLKRQHFASAMNLLGETDGSAALHSYLDLVGILESSGGATLEDVQQLWKRLVLSICISNTDDHLRNHGFLLDPEKDTWRLSPAYDVNPDPEKAWLSLAIDFDDPSKDLRLALDVSDYFRFTADEARETAMEIQTIVRKNWQFLAGKYSVSRSEQERMAPAFSECERQL